MAGVPVNLAFLRIASPTDLVCPGWGAVGLCSVGVERPTSPSWSQPLSIWVLSLGISGLFVEEEAQMYEYVNFVLLALHFDLGL